jgi:translocator protein
MSEQTAPQTYTSVGTPTAETRKLPGWARPAAVAAAAAMLTAGIGGALTDLGPWYQALAMPSWKPVDAAFPIMWTLIFTLCAIAGVLQWQRAVIADERALVLGLWGFNAVMNIAWSWLFFDLQRPDLALFQVPVLWLSILALVVILWHLSKRASLLLVPYLGWVGVAAMLNLEIVRLNGM